MDLSIIIVSFNTKKFTLDCITSIVKANPKLTYEIIVVDNASTDGSIEAIKKLEGVKLVANKENVGYATANNKGIKIANGNYLLALNSDTIVKRGSLERLINLAKSNSEIGVVGAKLLNGDGTVQNSVFHFPTIRNAIKEYWLGIKNANSLYTPKDKKPSEVDAVPGTAFLITPEAREKVGLFNEQYFIYFEDLDYCRRIKEVGLKVYYLPTAPIIHYHGQSGKKISEWDTQWRRLIPASKIYHGTLKHNVITFILWSGQKWQKLLKRG